MVMKSVLGWIFAVTTVFVMMAFTLTALLGNQTMDTWLNKTGVLPVLWVILWVWMLSGITGFILLFLPAKATAVRKNVSKNPPVPLSQRTKQAAE
ncbi:MAG: hypothetical protein Q8M83_06200 [bacterium]|nr:hypothetical protein [bacterium]